MTARGLARSAGVAASALAAIGSLGLFGYGALATIVSRADWADRLFFLSVATLIMAFAIFLLILRGKSLGGLSRPAAGLLVIALVVVLGLTGFAAVGVDSTRPVRDLPEAAFAFPGAEETGRNARAAWGSMLFRGGPASFNRSYTTSATYGEVVAYFHRELPARGWSGHYHFGYGADAVVHNWMKDGFTFQLDMPTDNLRRSGSFHTRIWGREPS